MLKNRRRLSFVPTSENKATDEGKKCTLCHNPHTQLSAPMSWKNIEAQKLALTSLSLTHQCLVCRLCRDDIGRMVKNPHIKPRWERERERKTAASQCVAMYRSHFPKLPVVSKSHKCFNVKLCHIQHHYANSTTILFMKHYSLKVLIVAPVIQL